MMSLGSTEGIGFSVQHISDVERFATSCLPSGLKALTSLLPSAPPPLPVKPYLCFEAQRTIYPLIPWSSVDSFHMWMACGLSHTTYHGLPSMLVGFPA